MIIIGSYLYNQDDREQMGDRTQISLREQSTNQKTLRKGLNMCKERNYFNHLEKYDMLYQEFLKLIKNIEDFILRFLTARLTLNAK